MRRTESGYVITAWNVERGKRYRLRWWIGTRQRKLRARNRRRKRQSWKSFTNSKKHSEWTTPREVDASLKVGEGVFLPDGEGMFVVEGKSVRVLDQVASHLKADKLRVLAQVISPVPVVPGKQNLVLPGTHAALRIRSKTPEFYLREVTTDSVEGTKIQSSKPIGDAGPEVELVRAKVTKNGRLLESISTMFGESVSKKRNNVSIQRWEVAPSLYRFTLSEPLPPGEYILAQVVEEGLDMFVWEFGVDEPGGAVKK